MQALLTSMFCPKDCDRKIVVSQRELGDKIFEALKKNFGDFIYAPRRDITFMNILTEVQPMKAPTGMIFHMDFRYDFKDENDTKIGSGPGDAGDTRVSGSVDRILPKRRIRGDVR